MTSVYRLITLIWQVFIFLIFLSVKLGVRVKPQAHNDAYHDHALFSIRDREYHHLTPKVVM